MKDADDEVILRVKGPCCCVMCGCQDKKFPVKSPLVDTATGENIGYITKKWGGFVREAYTDADLFSVTFPLELDVKAKAVLLGATFLIGSPSRFHGVRESKKIPQIAETTFLST
ncbi:Scramblase [Ancylostoma duodenale]|uniref:Phospholipid scramblase n=1 Tax=Ancylostoma duodenale TaxID=51022 RepID=A0A0C2GXJ6_9BILA|nr:Scramblase [Ancylostoma duodenale]